LQKLIDNPSSTVFVGGKGGVGKTTISSSIALEIAKQHADGNNNQRVLIVSTDPAHSLSDCLDVELSDTPKRIDMMGSSGSSGELYAQEIDAESALEQFRDTLSAFDATKLATALQISPEFLESLGLAEIATVLQNPPPGLDELVALSNVFDNDDKFDIVVVDTAPTGHTLRLLALPEFLDSFLGKLIRLRMKLSGLISTLQAFMGGGEAAEQRQATIDTALRQLEVFQAKMAKLRTRLQNQAETDFVVVSIPTALSVAESKRLVDELVRQNVHVSNLVVNQCIFPNNNVNYYRNRCKGQEKWMKTLQERIEAVSATPEYQRTGPKRPIAITKVPFFDVELVGIPALGYVGAQSFDDDTFGYLLDDQQQRVVICGGKGGVGKVRPTFRCALLLVPMSC
jgi:arsenite/tail-anchored protein-transporting ATPase